MEATAHQLIGQPLRPPESRHRQAHDQQERLAPGTAKIGGRDPHLAVACVAGLFRRGNRHRPSSPSQTVFAKWDSSSGTAFAKYGVRQARAAGGGMAAEEPRDVIWMRPERAATGRPAQRSRAEITAAAVTIAGREGLGAVSMRRVATELGTG
jgi:hypothetical protein